MTSSERPGLTAGWEWCPGPAGRAIGDLERSWERDDPRRDRTMIPYNDGDTAMVIDEAITAVILGRAPMWLGDAGPTVSVLVSLAAEVDSRVPDAVADARGQGYSWDQIASRLATSVSCAQHRYAAYTRWRACLPVDWD